MNRRTRVAGRPRRVDPFLYCRRRGIAVARASLEVPFVIRRDGDQLTIVLNDAVSFVAQQRALVDALRSIELPP